MVLESMQSRHLWFLVPKTPLAPGRSLVRSLVRLSSLWRWAGLRSETLDPRSEGDYKGRANKPESI